MNAPKYIKSHPNYNADDYAYLSGKGWTNVQILARWNEERSQGKSACGWNGHFAKLKLNGVR